MSKQIRIDPITTHSLIIQMTVNDNPLGTGTGFVVKSDGREYLVTNWHNLSGRHPESGAVLHSQGGLPEEVIIMHHSSQRLGSWTPREEPLEDSSGDRRWHAHPDGSNVDIAALPLQNTDSVTTYTLDLDLANEGLALQPAMAVSIVGFPLGETASGALPIWKTGHIASDPDVDYGGNPVFLVDATTRSGMSGSPVYRREYGAVRKEGGGMELGTGSSTQFLGIYSGRIRDNSEVGRVWKPKAIRELLANI